MRRPAWSRTVMWGGGFFTVIVVPILTILPGKHFAPKREARAFVRKIPACRHQLHANSQTISN